MIFFNKDMANKTLIDYAQGRAVGKFDRDGYIEVMDEVHIAKMKRKGYKAAGEQGRGEEPAPSVKPQAAKPEAQELYCKVCGLPFASKGAYLAHCRTKEHKEKKA